MPKSILFILALGLSCAPPSMAQLQDATTCKVMLASGRVTEVLGIVFDQKPKVGQSLWLVVPTTGAHRVLSITHVEQSPIEGWEVKVDLKPLSELSAPSDLLELEAAVLYPAPVKAPGLVPIQPNMLPKHVHPSQIGACLDTDQDGQPDLVFTSPCCKGSWLQGPDGIYCPDDLTCTDVWRKSGTKWTVWIHRPPC